MRYIKVGIGSISYLVFHFHTNRIEKWKHYFHCHSGVTIQEASSSLINKLCEQWKEQNRKPYFLLRFVLENRCCQDHGLHWDIFELPLSLWTRQTLQSESHRIAVLFPWLGAINHGCMPPTNENIFLLDSQESWKGSREECSILNTSLFILESVQDVFILLVYFQQECWSPVVKQVHYATVLWSQSHLLANSRMSLVHFSHRNTRTGILLSVERH